MRASADAGFRTVREVAARGDVPLHLHPEWADALPWLVQGTTGRGGDEPFDLGWFGDTPSATVLARWRALRHETGCRKAVHARQVHGATVLRHDDGPAGVVVADDADGHVTRAAGTLLTVSVADCVPIAIVDPGDRAVALLHGGWRGVAAGILEAGLRALLASTAGDVARLLVHMGPSICGACYEVGPEVHEALGLDVPGGPTPVDLRATLGARAVDAGIPADAITISEHCTRCGDGSFFSHRGGDRARQVSVLGVREAGPAA